MRPPREVAPLKDITTIFTGLIPSRLGSRPGAQEYPVINAKDVGGKLPAIGSLDRQPISSKSVLDRYGLKAGDVIVTARGVAVKASVADEQHKDVLAGANLIVLRPKVPLNSRLLSVWLQHSRIQEALLQTRTGASTAGFTTTQLGSLQIALPQEDDQKTLAQIMALAEEQYEAAVRAANLRREFSADLVFDAFNAAIVEAE